jgi:hypothetical protein
MDPNNAGNSGKGRGNMGINFDQAGSGGASSGGGGMASSSGGGSRSDSVMRTGKGGSGGDSGKGGSGDGGKGGGDSSKGGSEGRGATARADRDATSKGASSDAPASQPRGEGVARDGASRGDTVARGESERGPAGRAEDSAPGGRASAGDTGRSAGPSAWSLASEGSGAPADPARLRGRGDAPPRSSPTTGSVPLQAGGGVVSLRPGDRLLPLASFDRGAVSQSQIASEMTGAFILRAATRVGPALAGSTGRPPPRPLPRWRGQRVLPAVVVVRPAVATDRGILGEAIAHYHQSGVR